MVIEYTKEAEKSISICLWTSMVVAVAIVAFDMQGGWLILCIFQAPLAAWDIIRGKTCQAVRV